MSSSANACNENIINENIVQNLKINIIRTISERKMTKEELEEFKRNLDNTKSKQNGGKKKTKKSPKKKSKRKVKRSPKKKSTRKVKR